MLCIRHFVVSSSGKFGCLVGWLLACLADGLINYILQHICVALIKVAHLQFNTGVLGCLVHIYVGTLECCS